MSHHPGTRRDPALFVLVMLLISSLAAVPVSGQDSGTKVPTAMVSNVSINPPILNPEGLGTITVVIQESRKVDVIEEYQDEDEKSYMKSWADSVFIDRVSLEGNGITVISPVFDRIGLLGPDESLPLVFTIRAPPKSGIYYPEVWVQTTGGNVRYPIRVNVNTAIDIQRPAVMIMESAFSGLANPGDEIPVNLTVINEGKTLAGDVILKIGNASEGIAPKTTNIYTLGSINPGEQVSVNIVLISDKTVDAGLISIPVSLDYTAIDGSPQEDTASIDVMMKGEAEMGFVSVDTSPRRVIAHQPFDITIRIENTGTGEAKQVAATIDLPMSGTKQSYIGKIGPGNDAPAVFLMDGGPEGSYTYTTTITYVDDTGTHTEAREMTLRVTRDDSAWIGILALLILAGAGLVAYWYWYRPRTAGREVFPWEKRE